MDTGRPWPQASRMGEKLRIVGIPWTGCFMRKGRRRLEKSVNRVVGKFDERASRFASRFFFELSTSLTTEL